MRKLGIRAAVVAGVAVVATVGTAVLWGQWNEDGPAVTARGTASSSAEAAELTALVNRTQERLARLPGDWQGWAELGMARVQLARVTADPQQYPAAEQALRTSLSLHAAKNNAPALTGLAALAAARHDFPTAVGYARQAVAGDPYSADAYGALADGLIESGQPEQGFTAVQKMVDLRPDTGSLSRASYAYELRGDLPRARELMGRARTAATDPGDISFTLTHLGALALTAGDLDAAGAAYAEGLSRQPANAGLLAGRARLELARGDDRAAITDLRSAIAVLPTPEYATLLGDLLAKIGDTEGAEKAYDLVRAAGKLGPPDVDLVLFWADHGEAAHAVEAAQQIEKTRKSTVVADVYAWALHAAGRDAQAKPWADQALRLGTHDARAVFHRGMIRDALGDTAGARADLAEALRVNPAFAPREAATARATLAKLGRGR